MISLTDNSDTKDYFLATDSDISIMSVPSLSDTVSAQVSDFLRYAN